jgi:hypothetical protein
MKPSRLQIPLIDVLAAFRSHWAELYRMGGVEPAQADEWALRKTLRLEETLLEALRQADMPPRFVPPPATQGEPGPGDGDNPE